MAAGMVSRAITMISPTTRIIITAVSPIRQVNSICSASTFTPEMAA